MGSPRPTMIDARERVSGRVGYTVDVALPGMLHAKLLRSTVAAARIRRLDVSRARQVRGVAVVLTGADVASYANLSPRFGPVIKDEPVLAMDVVRYVGEPVVAVAAVDADTAEYALSLVDVEYEPIPAVFEPEDALADGAPLVHDGDVPANPAGRNVCSAFRLRRGDVEAGFAEAAHVFEDTFRSPSHQHITLESHVCVAAVAHDRVTVWTANQTPYSVRNQLAHLFQLPVAKVRVVVPTLGGGYGGKTHARIEPVVAVLAMAARRPVRLWLTRAEEFVTNRKHDAIVTVRTGLDADGRLVARSIRAIYNTGAYAHIGPRVAMNGGIYSNGPYRCPNVSVDGLAVYTNTPSAGAFRGFGTPQVTWAYETQMDMIAERLGIDGIELRQRNLLVPGDLFATGQPMTECHSRQLLDQAADWLERESPAEPGRTGRRVRGTGVACFVKGTLAPSTSTVIAKLGLDGSLNVLTSSIEMGQGVKTALALIGARELGVPVTSVVVSDVDTEHTPFDHGTVSSRSTASMGGALIRAIATIRQQLLDHASSMLEIAPDDLEFDGPTIRAKGLPQRCLSFGDIVARTGTGNLVAYATHQTTGGLDPETGQGVGTATFHEGVAAAEVEVDLETGAVRLLRCQGSVYAGRVINPAQAELQTEGNMIFGIGQALHEEIVFDGGQIANPSLADYMIPSIVDVPELATVVLEEPDPPEIHGVGESALSPVAPAIGNAVYRATGVRVTDLPITAEKVLRALRQREAAGPPD